MSTNENGYTPCEEYGHDYYTTGNVHRCADCGDEYEMDDEPDIDFGFEHDSSMASVGWGTDEDYGFYGDDFE